MEHQDIMRRIEEKFETMSKGQKRIARYILEYYDKAAFMTALKLGDKVGVSESTVVRFANLLGYDGYPRLQKALQEMIRNKLTSVQRIEMTTDMNQSKILSTVLKADMQNIRLTIEEINEDVFSQAVEEILKARRVYILGVRSSEPLAEFLAHYMNYIIDNVQLVSLGVNDVYEHFIRLTPEDVCIGISFPRYSSRTVGGMRYAREKGAKVIVVTDSKNSPVAEYADYSLIARSNMASFVDSLVAPLSVINALLVALGSQRKDEVSASFSQLETLWRLHSVYSSENK